MNIKMNVDLIKSGINSKRTSIEKINNTGLGELVGCHKQAFTEWKKSMPVSVEALVVLSRKSGHTIEELLIIEENV